MWGRNHIQLFLVVVLRRAGDVSSHLCSNQNKYLKPDRDILLIQTDLNKKPSVWTYLWFCRELVIQLDVNAVRSVLQFFCLLQFVSCDRSVSLPRRVCQKHLNSLNTAGNRFDTSWWKQSQWSLKCLTSCWWSLVSLQALLKPLQRPLEGPWAPVWEPLSFRGVFHGSHPQLLIKIDLRLINRVVPGNQSDGWRSPELRGKIEGERSASGVQSIKNITTVNLKCCSDSEDVITNISQLYSHYRAISCVDYYSNIR